MNQRREERRARRREEQLRQGTVATSVAAPAHAPRVRSSAEPPAPALLSGPLSIPAATVSSPEERVPRLPCPVCGFLIPISLADLIHMQGFTCAQCQNVLTMDRDKSGEALKHLATLYAGLKDSRL